MGEEKLNLYKYRPINDWTIKALKERTIYFNCPNEYNDPFDCRLNFFIDGSEDEWEAFKNHRGISVEELNSYRAERKRAKENSGYFDKELQSHSLINTRISSFSEVPDSTLMWSHYADYHKGICLIFETIKLDTIQSYMIFNGEDLNSTSNLPPNYAGIIRVRYSDKMPEAYNHLEYNQNKILAFLITKSTDWAYEKEWRMLLSTTALRTDNPRYIENQLKGVIFGLNCKEESKSLVKESLKDLNVEFYQCHAVNSEYKVEIKPG